MFGVGFVAGPLMTGRIRRDHERLVLAGEQGVVGVVGVVGPEGQRVCCLLWNACRLGKSCLRGWLGVGYLLEEDSNPHAN